MSNRSAERKRAKSRELPRRVLRRCRKVLRIGGGLLVMGGDWNYAAKMCSYGGVETVEFKRDYACTTAGLTATCDGGATPNLGWIDPLLEHDPTIYDQRKSIDFLHGKDIGESTPNLTERNSVAGIIGKHFYCDGHGPYGEGDPDDEAERMADHDGRLVRFHY